MEITVSNEQGRVPVTVFHISGDIDTSSYEQLQSQAQQAIQGGTRFMVLDLAKVGYVSSYGIRAISQVYSWLKDQSGDASSRAGVTASPYLKIAAASPTVQAVFSATGLDLYVECVSDVKKAVAAF